jgi:hypothetical protein
MPVGEKKTAWQLSFGMLTYRGSCLVDSDHAMEDLLLSIPEQWELCLPALPALPGFGCLVFLPSVAPMASGPVDGRGLGLFAGDLGRSLCPGTS